MTSTLREARRQETRNALLSAAETLFAERGLSEATVEQIAEKAGVSVGTIYNYFNDRDELLKELLAVRRSELEERLDDAFEHMKGRSLGAQVEELARVVFSHFQEHGPFLQVALEIEHQRSMQALRAKSKPLTSMRVVYEAAQKLLDRAGVRDELAATFLTGILRGALIKDLHSEKKLGLEEKVKAVAEFFVRGVGR